MTQTQTNTNTNEYNLDNLISGYECEVGSPRGNYISPDIIRRALKNANLNYVYVVTDGSSNVDAEIIFPPLIINQISIEMFFKPVLDVIASTGAIVRKNCGGHIHVGVKTALGSAIEFNQNQIEYFKSKINNELQQDNHLNYVTNVKGEMTKWDAFTKLSSVESDKHNFIKNHSMVMMACELANTTLVWNGSFTGYEYKDSKRFDGEYNVEYGKHATAEQNKKYATNLVGYL